LFYKKDLLWQIQLNTLTSLGGQAMVDVAPLKPYLERLEEKLATGDTTEHTHRSTLEILVESFGDDIKAINEPKRIECGAPDLAVLRDGFMVGHIEAKDIGTSLDSAERSDQLKRYLHSLPNLILTDYLEFRWYIDGEHRRTVKLGRLGADGRIGVDRAGKENVAGLLCDFLAHEPEPIGTARGLAERLARLTHLIRDIIVTAFGKDKASDLLTDWRQAFAEVLVAELDQPENVGQFADMFAQTLAYGLFSARIRYEQGDFTRQKAQSLIPRTNPFLRDFFYYITGPQLEDEPYAGLVEDLVQLLALAEMDEILADFGQRTRQEDPTVHFYETFLAAYDPELRERRGVYYTPDPVVSYIVRSVDALLKDRFGLPKGLADTTKLPDGTHKVLVLDPACGTGTFLYSVIDLIREDFMAADNAGMWSGYVRDHLLPRTFGFELLMAPYAVAHFKLALQLSGHDLPEAQRRQWAYDFRSDERLQIYLTNTLERTEEQVKSLWGPLKIVAQEAQAANAVKEELPIMVILGNPPYSNFGQMNNGPWITELMEDWKPEGERKWNPDDFMKFMRWAQRRIEKTGIGILAFITPHTYLDGITHRRMRRSLVHTFDEIYVLDLQGSVRRPRETESGVPDKNVFDIQQGVAIGILVKTPEGRPTNRVQHSEYIGTRNSKYKFLAENDVTTTNWTLLNEVDRESCLGQFYFFAPMAFDNIGEYCQGPSVPACFTKKSSGIQTKRDDVAVAYSREGLISTLQFFASNSPQTVRTRFELPADGRDWKVEWASEHARGILDHDCEAVSTILYRVFDERYTVVDDESRAFVAYPRYDVMHHMLHPNLGLIVTRQLSSPDFKHAWVTQHPIDGNTISIRTREYNYVHPLYLYPKEDNTTLFDDTATSPWEPDPDHQNRVPNLSKAFVDGVTEKLGLDFDPHKCDDVDKDALGPRVMLAYVYALFHSPTYRQRYADFLKIDFPRVPLTSDVDLFWNLVELGSQLIDLHLMDHPKLSETITSFPIRGDNRVKPRGGFPKFIPAGESRTKTGEVAEENRVYINLKQYFKGVSKDVWEFEVGGYQVLHKWLKDRKGRVLSYDDLEHYQKIVVALKETIRLMDEIDETIPRWPID
jgi:hypothetical protein